MRSLIRQDQKSKEEVAPKVSLRHLPTCPEIAKTTWLDSNIWAGIYARPCFRYFICIEFLLIGCLACDIRFVADHVKWERPL